MKIEGGREMASLLCAVALAAAVSADVACSFEGATMNVAAPSTHAGCRLELLWDSADKGDDPSAWANASEIAAAVPAAGARYVVDLNSLGITNGTPCRIVAYERYRLLDMLKMPNSKAYIDTGIKDSDCYGVYFGFYGNEKSADFANFIGTSESSGFTVGANSSSVGSWYWYYRNGKYNPRPTVNTDSINEASFENQTFTLNGSVVKSGLPAGSVGASGANMFLGTWGAKNRFLYGWWSYVRFTDENGDALLDYIPVKRGDGVVGFWDRVTDKLVTSTGGGAFTAGTVTNQGFEVVFSMQRVSPNHAISLEVKGPRLYALVPAGLAGEQLMLAWGDVDYGGDIADWPNSVELAAVVGKNGGVYGADIARLGVRNGQTCRVFARHNLQLLDMLQMTGTKAQAFVDTGFKDSVVYGVRFGFYGTTATEAFAAIIGTNGESGQGGFHVSASNTDAAHWVLVYRGVKDVTGSTRPSVSTSSINDVAFTNRVVTLNGSNLKTNLEKGPVGYTGLNMAVGAAIGYGTTWRRHNGWWSYVRFDDADGNAILDYIPVQLANGTVGFYDRATSSFVYNSGTGSFTAGTVTNTCVTAVNSSSATIARSIPTLDVSLSGMTLSVTAPAGLVGEQLLLLWDVADKGDDIAAWANSHELSASLPAQGGTFSVGLDVLGIGRGHVCRVVSMNQVKLLDKLKMPNTQTYVNTGIPDNRCHGVRLGFYGNEGHTSNAGAFQLFVGTGIDVVGQYPNCFALGMNNTRFDSWTLIYRNTKPEPRPTGIYTDSINDVVLTNRTLSINGEVKLAGLAVGPLGETGLGMHLGTTAFDKGRYLFGWWSYARLEDEAGNALIDYIPATRAVDGKVGFIDRVTGAFVVSSGTGNFTAGTETNASFTITHLERTVDLADVVATAAWTGLGAAGALDDPANWACTNLYGEEVSGLPNEYTHVTIPSAADFSCPAGSVFVCRSVSIGGALAADCDWRGFNFAKASGAIDLAGHVLHTVAFGDMVLSMTVTDTIGGGVLRLAVPDTVVASNSAVAFTGAMKLVKEDAGTFVAAKTGQTYSGGTDVEGGTFACGGSGADGIYGVVGSTNTVFAGASFDCRAIGIHCFNPFVLAGGTLVDPRYVADVYLTADSFAVANSTGICFANQNLTAAAMEMGGHRLTLDIGSSTQLTMANLTVTGGGVFYQRTGGFVKFGADAGGMGVMATTTTLDACRSISVKGETTFLNYIAEYQGLYDSGALNPIKVLGRFCPGGSHAWHSVELQNGATLDLSQQTGVWAATNTASHFDGTSTLTFAPGAVVTVEMGERIPQRDDQLVSWANTPSSVDFTWEWPLPLYASRRGLFVKFAPGLMIKIK
jgi:hypothetical protein